jgi:hypothetical protein
MAILGAALSTGCAAGEDAPTDEMVETYRSGGVPSPPSYPGNGDLSIYAGSDTSSADCLIYDFLGPNVHDGAAGSDNILVTIVGNAIQAPDGTVLCTREGNALIDTVHVGGPEGPVLFTSFGRWVFDGTLDFEGDSLLQIAQELDEQLLYTFQGAHILDGAFIWDGILATSTKPLTHANTQRKLVIAAMISGECGGLGIPEEP